MKIKLFAKKKKNQTLGTQLWVSLRTTIQMQDWIVPKGNNTEKN
jgi:hypothetical protein